MPTTTYGRWLSAVSRRLKRMPRILSTSRPWREKIISCRSRPHAHWTAPPPRLPALVALNAALLRVTGENRETSRDARLALLQRIGTLGTPSQGSQLQVYLYDWDPAVAAEAARILSRWAGTPEAAAPNALPYGALPTLSRDHRVGRIPRDLPPARGRVVRDDVTAFDAPTNVERFARLARAGYYDGLTFIAWSPTS